jgi:hypothetical protein
VRGGHVANYRYRAGRYRGIEQATGTLLAAMTLVVSAAPAQAQTVPRDPTLDALPRPGYEPRPIRLGSWVIEPTLETRVWFNNNIRAAPSRKRSDAVLTVSPRVDVRRIRGTNELRLDAHAALLRYARTPRENVDTFGAQASMRQTIGSAHALEATAAYDRTFEQRFDPEADVAFARRPALIDATRGELQYRYVGARVGAAVTLGINRFDYRAREDRDRDLMSYSVAVRGFIAVSPRASLFVQPYANCREPGTLFDRAGVQRETFTSGALAGLALDLTDRIQGEMGLGVFRADPADPRLNAFTGVAANGRLTWHPRTRTLVSLVVFRGDVATIRIGAIGRIDSTVDLRVEQEARHNLLVHGTVGLRSIGYRGLSEQDQRYFRTSVGARYLVNRQVSVGVEAGYLNRDAPDPLRRFDRWQGSLIVRFVL